MKKTMQDILRSVAEQSDQTKERLLDAASRRYQQRLTELQRSYAEEMEEIRAEFGDVEKTALLKEEVPEPKPDPAYS